MDWSDADLEDVWSRLDMCPLPSVTKAIMTRAVELAAASGGTMTAEVLGDRLRRIKAAFSGFGDKFAGVLLAMTLDVESHISALGARVAVLEAENERFTSLVMETGKERDAAKEGAEHLRERLAAAEEANRELVRRAQQAEGQVARAVRVEGVLTEQVERYRSETEKLEHQRLRMAAEIIRLREQCTALEEERTRQSYRANALSAAGQVLSAHVDSHECDASCTHSGIDDAETTRRDKDGWDAPPTRYPFSPTCTHDDAATPGHPERVKERSEAVKSTTGLGMCCAIQGERDAEAMRAACWEAIRRECEKDGIGETSYIYKRFKSAIEGAAP